MAEGTDFPPRAGEDYAQALSDLLPTGPAWSREPSEPLMHLVAGLGETWGRVDARAQDLLRRETDPRYAVDLLAEWERAFGLPDPCVPVIQSLTERRRALLQRITTEGGQSRAFFIGVAAALGYRIQITEFSPFQFGLSGFGGPRGEFLPPSARYLWRVRVLGGRVTRFHFGASAFGRDPFTDIRKAEDLECMFRRWKPAHSAVVFDYLAVDPTPRIKRFEFGASSLGFDPFDQVALG